MDLCDLLARLRSLVQFEQFRGPPGICSAKEFQTILDSERCRADRNRHQFSLVVFDMGRSDEDHSQIRYLAHVLRDRIRSTDRVGWLDNRRVGVVLPYTSEAGAWRLADDVCQAMAGKAARPECSVYTYPSRCDRENGGHSEQLHFADFSPEWKTTSPEGFSRSARHASSLNNDFALQQSPVDAIRNRREVVHSPELLFAQRLPLWKRGMDIVGALLALIVLSPILLLVGLIIRIVSPGPIIFRQERLRCLGRMFRMWKFRTMGVDTDTSIHKNHVVALINGDKNGNPGVKNPMVKLEDHPQIIPLGRFFRKMCLDELPQLINVLRGEMSLVGPRPPLPYEVEEYPQWCYGRFNAVPGMTGLWQVSGKNRLSFDEMVRLDIRYSKQESLWLDTKIMMKTPLAIILQIKDSLRGNNGRNGG
jgi:lipopolysaccharide/colanic/teichoic acid biosynthesis glycosyltransferase